MRSPYSNETSLLVLSWDGSYTALDLLPPVMNAVRFGSLTIVAGLFLPSASIRADLVQAADPRYGPNSITIDTASGLAWLGLPFSRGFSYQQAVLATQPGGDFAGFRPATAQEVLSLYADAGIPSTGWFPATSPSLQPILSLINLVGATSSQDGHSETFGITITLGNSGRVAPGLDFGYMDAVPGYLVYGVPGQTVEVGDTFASSARGTWLVSVAPEPATWLIGSLGGLILLVSSRRRPNNPRAHRVNTLIARGGALERPFPALDEAAV